jgi:CheY-like chemotaxis protein
LNFVRVRITRQPTGSVDGIELAKFLEGLTYEVGTTLANYLLAQQWAEPADEQAPAAILPLNRTIRRASVLVLEDDADLREIELRLLEFNGWPAFAAPDGIEGLKALREHRPSLILLDLAMPRMDGVQFRAAQRQLSDRRLANVPVVVVSAIPDAPRYKSRLNAADVLVKPFEPDRLLQAVESHIRPVSLFHL